MSSSVTTGHDFAVDADAAGPLIVQGRGAEGGVEVEAAFMIVVVEWIKVMFMHQ